MKRSAWAITLVLVLVAVVAAWFFGLDARHAVALVGAAVAAGIANGLLESVDVPRTRLTPLPDRVRGLAEVQALEFSLSSTDPGMRAVLEVHALAAAAARARPGIPRSAPLDAFLAQQQPAPLDHRTLSAFADELERLVPAPSEAARAGGTAAGVGPAGTPTSALPSSASPAQRGAAPTAPNSREIR